MQQHAHFLRAFCTGRVVRGELAGRRLLVVFADFVAFEVAFREDLLLPFV